MKNSTKLQCRYCEHENSCQHQPKVKAGKICNFFIPKYNCGACARQKCADKMLCYRFIPKKPSTELDEHPIEKTIFNILTDLIRVERSTENAIIQFKQRLEANGVKAALRDRTFITYIDNLLALAVLDKLIKSYGLNEFRAQIMCNEIDRIFKTDKAIPIQT